MPSKATSKSSKLDTEEPAASVRPSPSLSIPSLQASKSSSSPDGSVHVGSCGSSLISLALAQPGSAKELSKLIGVVLTARLNSHLPLLSECGESLKKVLTVAVPAGAIKPVSAVSRLKSLILPPEEL